MLIGLLILLVVVVAYVIGLYNALIRIRNQVKNAWSQIDVQLKRRHDLIPNLIETVKGYMQHEKETLTSVIEARAKAINANGVADVSAAEGHLQTALDNCWQLWRIIQILRQIKALPLCRRNYHPLKTE